MAADNKVDVEAEMFIMLPDDVVKQLITTPVHCEFSRETYKLADPPFTGRLVFVTSEDFPRLAINGR